MIHNLKIIILAFPLTIIPLHAIEYYFLFFSKDQVHADNNFKRTRIFLHKKVAFHIEKNILFYEDHLYDFMPIQ